MAKDEKEKIVEVSKVKFNGEEVFIEYSKQIKENEYVESKFKSKDLPHPDFVSALEKLKDDFMIILELPNSYEESLEIRGMSVKLNDFLVKEGVTITGLKKLASGKCVCLNTPYLEFGEESLLDGNQIERIKHLAEEALKYIEGKRKHQQLKLVV